MWTKKAVDQGLASAMASLGGFYEDGHAVQQNEKTALEWYQRSAELGDINGQFNTGNYLLTGRGVERNPQEATKWLKLAAEQGHPNAAFNLGVQYLNGDGVNQDDEEAAKWLRIARDNGHPRAESLLDDIEDEDEIIEDEGTDSEDSTLVFSYANWDMAFGNLVFLEKTKQDLRAHDGEEVMRMGDQNMLKSMFPFTTISDFAVVPKGSSAVTIEQLQNDRDLFVKMMIEIRRQLAPIPYSFQTPAIIFGGNVLGLALVSLSQEEQWSFTIQSEMVFPSPDAAQALIDLLIGDKRIFSTGRLDNNHEMQVYLLSLDQLEQYVKKTVSAKTKSRIKNIDRDAAIEYFSQLFGFSDENAFFELAEKYENACVALMSSYEFDKRLVAEEQAERQRKAEEERRKAELERQRKAEEERRKAEAERQRKAEEERRRVEAERQRKAEEERRRAEAEQLKVSSVESLTLEKTGSFFTKIAGVTHSNTGSNTENRQRIIRDLYRRGLLNEGQELSLVQEPNNPYDHTAVAVFGPDGRQLGYLAKETARNVFLQMNSGIVNKAFVSVVTGGDADFNYGVNIRVESYARKKTTSFPQFVAGDVITFGRYPFSEDGREQKDIEWFVLKATDEKLILLSKYILDQLPYTTYTGPRTDMKQYLNSDGEYGYVWHNSTIREWLNSTFISQAFSSAETQVIMTETLSFPKYSETWENEEFHLKSTFSAEPLEDTHDRVYLASNEDLELLGSVTILRPEQARTPFVQSKIGDDMWAKYEQKWWLRTQPISTEYNQALYSDQYMYPGDNENLPIEDNAAAKPSGIRPMISIDLKKYSVIWTSMAESQRSNLCRLVEQSRTENYREKLRIEQARKEYAEKRALEEQQKQATAQAKAQAQSASNGVSKGTVQGNYYVEDFDEDAFYDQCEREAWAEEHLNPWGTEDCGDGYIDADGVFTEY